MSKQVDERIVEMRFDNRDFEKNVATSMSTLDKLKQKLNFSNTSKGLDSLSTAAKNVDMSSLSNGVETVKLKFSALQTVATTALVNITNSVMSMAKRLGSAITIDPIKDGFAEYETQMNAVQTILANTQKEGTNVKTVNAALDELNHYADKTIYNFTEMTRNIGTFTAAGVKLNDSVSSIKGIANLAAVSGSTSRQASTAMYQLSQAIAAGKVQLMDWNSVVNAGMGGQVFQDALIRTSEHLKTGAKEAINTYGSFRESLTKSGWLTTEVLTQTLDQFATAADTQEEYEAAVKKFVDQGYSKEESKQMADMAKTAGDAATKVKTFSQLIDTLKEALGSGWTESWRLIIGDFEEAKTLWTGVSDVLSNYINKTSDARNAMLQEWSDLGGRTALIESFSNVFNGLLSVIKPIKEAFREIFPPITAQQLYKITECIRDLTAKMKISDSTAGKLKKTFEGVFSIFGIITDTIVSIVKGFAHLVSSFNGVHLGILDGTAALGGWLKKLRDSIKETDIFNKVLSKIGDGVKFVITGITDFGNSIKDNFRKNKDLVSFGNDFSTMIVNVISKLGDGLGAIRKAVDNLLGGRSILGIINDLILTGGLASFTFFQNDIQNGISEIIEYFNKNKKKMATIPEVLGQVKGCLKSYQRDINAKALLKIASAIAILAGSIFVLSSINGEDLARSLGGLGIVFGELLTALYAFNKISTKVKGAATAQMTMLTMAMAISIMAGALKKMSGVDTTSLVQGLTAISILLLEMQAFLTTNSFGDNLLKASTSMIAIGIALNILYKAAANFGTMDWTSIAKGLSSVFGLLLTSSIFLRSSSNSKGSLKNAASLILIVQALKSMAGAIKELSGISWEGISKGLVGISGALVAIIAAIKLIPSDTFWVAMDLPVVASALVGIANAMTKFSGMKWTSIAKGLTAISGALLALSISLRIMKGAISGAVALSIACTSLFSLVGVLSILGKMKWTGIAKGLIALSSAFTVIGVSATILSPLLPIVLGLGTAFTLLGIGITGIGAGLILIGAGLSSVGVGFASLAAAGVARATSFISSLSIIILGIIELFPAIGEKIAEGVVSFVKKIGESAQNIAIAIMETITGVLNTLSIYSPQIVESLFNFVIGMLQALRKHVPEFVEVVIGLIGDFFTALSKALGKYNASSIARAIGSVSLVVALMYALSGVASLIPSATIGVVGVGIVLGELTGVLAAFGALAQIPGLKWIIGEGGDLLQEIGTAIGKFIGGIAGGVVTGVVGQLPEIGTYLSLFMENVQPFLDGASKINKAAFDGVKELVNTILAITAANVLESIASWLTGGSSLKKFSKQLTVFGTSMKTFGDSVSDIDISAINSSVGAAKGLVELSNTLENSGGLISLFTGDNNLKRFGRQLSSFGEAMKSYSESVSGIEIQSVRRSVGVAKSLISLSDSIQNNNGGLISLFTGDNSLKQLGKSLVPFGKGMKSYSDAVADIKEEPVKTSVVVARQLCRLSDSIKNNNGGLISLFTGDNSLKQLGKSLVPFGEGMKSYSDAVNGLKPAPVMTSIIVAQQLVKLSDGIKNNSGGLLSLFTGDNNLKQMGESLVPFGEGMKAYSDAVVDIDIASVRNATNAGKMLVELSDSIQNNNGGLITLFTGDNSLANFSAQIRLFGDGISDYGESVSGLDVAAVTASIPAAQGLVSIANSLQNNTGGLFSVFNGDNDLGTFGDNLKEFGKGIKKYSESVADLNIDAISASVQATNGLVNLTNAIPQNGGLNSIFTGSNDLSTFGSQLVLFGGAITQYAKSVSELNESSLGSMDIAAEATSKLVDVANTLPNLGGLSSVWSGDTSLATFGNQLSLFGTSIVAYADSVSGMSEETLTAIRTSINAASALSGLYDYVPKLGGLSSMFSGEQNLILVGNQLASFGRSLKTYGDAVVDVKTDVITNSISAVSALCSIYDYMPKLGGLSSVFSGEQNLILFGNQLAPFGEGLAAYSKSVENVKADKISGSSEAVKSLADIYNNLENSGGISGWINGEQDMSAFGSQLESFGDSLAKYSTSVTNVDSGKVTNSATAAMNLVSVIRDISGVNTDNVGSFVEAINALGTAQVENFVKAFSDSSAASRLEKAGLNLIASLEKGIKSKKESLKSSMTAILNIIIKDVKDNTDKFKSPGEKIITKLIAGIKGKKVDLSKAITNVIKSALNDIKSYYKDYYSAGSYLVSGFANGISKNSYKAAAQAKAMAKAAYTAAKAQLDINSPSRVFRKLGSFVPEGFAQGIERFSRLSTRSSEGMAKQAIATAQTALSQMALAVASGMSDAPTITPVLDLSNVQSGMSTLGSMLNGVSGVGLSANLNAIGTMRAARRQNGNNGDVVSAIKGLSKDISNMDRNSYNINGITYDQGTEVADAIETLVKATIIDRRS